MTDLPAGVLASILDRLDRLEQERTAPGEELVPTYLQTNADGSISAVFPGGVQITEGASNPYSEQNAIGWTDPATGAIREYITGTHDFPAAGRHLLWLFSSNDPTNNSWLSLRSDIPAGVGTSRIEATSTDPGNTANVLLIDSLGESSFPQLTSHRRQLIGQPARAYRNAALSLPGGGPSWTSLAVDTIDFDPDGAFSGGSYTCGYAGRYLVETQFQAQLENNPQAFNAAIGRNGIEYSRGDGITVRGGTAGDHYGCTAVGIIPCAAGDTIQGLAFNNGANPTPLDVGASQMNHLTVIQVG